MSKLILSSFLLILFGINFSLFGQQIDKEVPENIMDNIYQEIKTPYKYGLVIAPHNNGLEYDCPSVFRKGRKWYMIYLVYDGRGYETLLAESKNLLNWKYLGKVLSFSDSTDWDANQKAGYAALEDYKWGGSYQLKRFANKYWMSYLGGPTKGYEAGILSIGIAHTKTSPAKAHEWNRLKRPALTVHDSDVSWWDTRTLYKSTIIWDKSQRIGYPFVMYYNAKGKDTLDPKRETERIGMAVSKDMVHWKRFGKNPVLDHQHGITGDPYIQKIGNVWVMFYFGAWWGPTPGAFNRFACSYDLIHWTDWKGPNLIEPSEPYDDQYAHKTSIVKYKGIVYHFYCATNKANQRGIALATSKDLGKSNINFVNPPKGK